MRRKPFIRGFAMLLATICFLFTFSLCSSANEELPPHRTVRVGLPEHEPSADGRSDSKNSIFDKQYLQAIAEYSNWEFTYVGAPWKQCLEMTETGELDLLMDVTKTADRLPYLDFSKEAMGMEMCYLIAAENSRLSYNDYPAFNGLRVGYEEGGTILGDLMDYGQAMGFTVQGRAYHSNREMYTALQTGEIDAIVQTSYVEIPTGFVVLCKCAPSPVYIATSKKTPELKRELDKAMTQLLLYNPDFNAYIYQKIFGSTQTQNERYTSQEQAYLAAQPVVKVYYEKDWAPFEYEKNGEAAGITPDVIRAIGADTGIRFRFIETSSTEAIYDQLDEESADAIMAVSYDHLWAYTHELDTTQPYVSGSILRVKKNAAVHPQTVAVVKDIYLTSEIARTYPDLVPVEFATFNECMDAVAQGTADCTFLNYYQASYFRTLSAFDAFSYQPVDAITQGIALGVTKDSNPALFGILSKSLQRISKNELQDILSRDATIAEPLSPQMLLRHYPTQTTIAIGLFAILLSLLIFMSITSSQRRQQNLVLAQAKKEAEHANRAKSDFLSNMSHDMRTPLNAIVGMTNMAIDTIEDKKQSLDYLQIVKASSLHLLSLINDVLDISKIEQQKMVLTPKEFNLPALLTEVEKIVWPLLQEKRQHFTLETGNVTAEYLIGDMARIKQILLNFLSNAIKYTPPEGSIRLTIREKPAPDAHTVLLEIACTDTGIGIDAECQQTIFEPFVREVRSTINPVEGTGLGLAIVHSIVNAMGGSIRLVSEKGQGSTFTAVIPIEIAAKTSDPGAPASRNEQYLTGRHILVAEDQAINYAVIEYMLQAAGAVVERAENGQETLQRFRTAAPGSIDLILMDIMMPLMDGYEATRSIRSSDHPDARTIPIVAMTANAFAEDIQKSLDSGMDAHISKPVDPATVKKILCQVLQKTGLR